MSWLQYRHPEVLTSYSDPPRLLPILRDPAHPLGHMLRGDGPKQAQVTPLDLPCHTALEHDGIWI